jgi:transposase
MMSLPELPAEVRAGLAPEVQGYIAALEQAVVVLTTRMADLEARLAQNSTNSSRPPSSDPPGTPRGKPPRRGRPPGGQAGHPGRFRALRDPAEVDAIVVCVPGQCAGCGAALPATAAASDPADERRQVTEIPLAPAVVTEYRLAGRRCCHCGHLTRAPLPAEVGSDRIGFGPRLTAIAALLTGRYRLSKREAARCLDDVFGVDLAVGSVSALEQATSAALLPVITEAQVAVQQAAVANLDETSWRQGRQRAWVWTMVTATLTIFHINQSRGGAVARTLLGAAWSGIVGSDRGTMYRWLPTDRRQVCWAHLKRDFQKLVDWGPTSRPTGQRLLQLEAQVFALWHRFRQGEIDRPALQLALAPLQAALWQVLLDGGDSATGKAAGVCWQLQQLWPALWTFAQVEGVEPTNNAAERALRPAVLWRKGSFGTHSEAGSRFVERMLTATTTCRQQGRPLLDLLVTAITAHRRGTPPPSLVTAPG